MSQTAATWQLGSRCHWNCEPKPPPTTPIRTVLPVWPRAGEAAVSAAAPAALCMNCLRLYSDSLFIFLSPAIGTPGCLERHALPPLSPESYITFDEFPNHDPFTRQQLRPPAKFL